MTTTYNLYENNFSLFICYRNKIVHKHLYDKRLSFKCLIKLFIQTKLKLCFNAVER